MVWTPFPDPLWGTCVSASGIWVRWSAIFIQIVARKNLHTLEPKRCPRKLTWLQKRGISLIILYIIHSLCGSFCRILLSLSFQGRLCFFVSLWSVQSGSHQRQSCQNVQQPMSFQSWVLSIYFPWLVLVKVMNVGVVKSRKELFTPCQPSRHLKFKLSLLHKWIKVFSHCSQTSCPTPAKFLIMLFSINVLMPQSIANQVPTVLCCTWSETLPILLGSHTALFFMSLIWLLTQHTVSNASVCFFAV